MSLRDVAHSGRPLSPRAAEVLAAIRAEPGIAMADLKRRIPWAPTGGGWTQIDTLSHRDLIRVEEAGGRYYSLRLYPIEGTEAQS